MAVSVEQFYVLISFILAIFVIVAIMVFMRRRRFRFPFYQVLLLVVCAAYFVIKFLESDVIAFLFAWFSVIMAVNVAFSILSFLNIELNEKLAASLMFVAISGGGVLTNIFILSTPVSLWIKGFALTVLIALHVPFLIAMMAYFKGKRELSKKLLRGLYSSKNPKS